MALYEYKCSCGREKEIISAMTAIAKKIPCICGQYMDKIISLPNTDMVHNVRYSSAMGVNPNRIPEMERRYPGSRYTPDGRLEVESRKDKLHKMKERNLTEI